MEWGCMGFLLGALTAIVFVGIGVCIGRNDKGESNGDTDNRVCVHCGDWNRSSDHGQPQQMDPEEVTAVLYLLRIGASSREKQVIDYLIDKEERENNEEQNQA